VKTVKVVQLDQLAMDRYYDIVIRQVAPGEAGANHIINGGVFEVVVGFGEMHGDKRYAVGLILKYKGDDLAQAKAVFDKLRAEKIEHGYTERAPGAPKRPV
jgi:hypothetical protein